MANKSAKLITKPFVKKSCFYLRDLIIYANKNHNTRKTHNDQNMLVYVYGIQNDLVHLNVGESSRLESKSCTVMFYEWLIGISSSNPRKIQEKWQNGMWIFCTDIRTPCLYLPYLKDT